VGYVLRGSCPYFEAVLTFLSKVQVTRNPLPRAIFKNTIDLWSGQRKCIIALTDREISLMINVFESKQRLPIEIIKRAYLEFIRACPS
jgi:hypothetical protein